MDKIKGRADLIKAFEDARTRIDIIKEGEKNIHEIGSKESNILPKEVKCF